MDIFAIEHRSTKSSYGYGIQIFNKRLHTFNLIKINYLFITFLQLNIKPKLERIVKYHSS